MQPNPTTVRVLIMLTSSRVNRLLFYSYSTREHVNSLTDLIGIQQHSFTYYHVTA